MEKALIQKARAGDKAAMAEFYVGGAEVARL